MRHEKDRMEAHSVRSARVSLTTVVMTCMMLIGLAVAETDDPMAVFTPGIERGLYLHIDCTNPNLQQAEPAVLDVTACNNGDEILILPSPLIVGNGPAKILWRKTSGVAWSQCQPVSDEIKENKCGTQTLAPGAMIRGRGVFLATSDNTTTPLIWQEPGVVEAAVTLKLDGEYTPLRAQTTAVTLTISPAQSPEAFALWKQALTDPKVAFLPGRLTLDMEPVKMLLRDYPESVYADWAKYFTAFRMDDPALDSKHALSTDEAFNLDDLMHSRRGFPIPDNAAVRLFEHHLQKGNLDEAGEFAKGLPALFDQFSFGPKLVRLRHRYAEMKKNAG